MSVVWFIGAIFRHCCFFFFNDTATTEISTLSLHDALPICVDGAREAARVRRLVAARRLEAGLDARREQMRLMVGAARQDRKSTRLNSSHANISYAVFCLKKKK